MRYRGGYKPRLSEFDKMITKEDCKKLVEFVRVKAERLQLAGRMVAYRATRDYMMVMACLKAGLRASEIGMLKTEDCHLRANPPFILIAGKKRKADEKDEVIIPYLLANLLQRWIGATGLKGEEPVFQVGNGETMSRKFAWRKLKDIYRLLKLSPLYNCHSLRHRFGTDTYVASGYDLELTRRQLRHRDIQVTQKYIHFAKMESEKLDNYMAAMEKETS